MQDKSSLVYLSFKKKPKHLRLHSKSKYIPKYYCTSLIVLPLLTFHGGL